MDWDLRLLVLAFQISYFFLSPLGFLTYKTDTVISLENYFEIYGENCDKIPSILIIVIDIATIIRRVKTVLCRSDSRIKVFHNFFDWHTIQTVFFAVFQTNNGETLIFIFLFVRNSFISRKQFCSAHITSAFRMCLCASGMKTSLSQLRKIKIISAHGRKMIQFSTIAQSACFGLQQNL